jgi:hypothetical protein
LFYLGIVVAAVVVRFFLVDRLAHAPFGRVLGAIRDDEQVAGRTSSCSRCGRSASLAPERVQHPPLPMAAAEPAAARS